MKNGARGALVFAALLACTGSARAALHTEAVEYRQGGALLEGYLAYDDALQGKRPGVEVLKRHPRGDPSRMAAMGYCFGGMAALELARSGEDLRGVVSFHGVLSTPHPEDAKKIKGRVLVLHGADDPNVSPQEVAIFEEEMRAAGVKYRLVQYPGAVHSFTVPEAGNDPSLGIAYDAAADARSWEELKRFLAQIFGSE